MYITSILSSMTHSLSCSRLGPHKRKNLPMCATSDDSDQPVIQCILIQTISTHKRHLLILAYLKRGRQTLRSACAHAQADLSVLLSALSHYWNFLMPQLVEKVNTHKRFISWSIFFAVEVFVNVCRLLHISSQDMPKGNFEGWIIIHKKNKFQKMWLSNIRYDTL